MPHKNDSLRRMIAIHKILADTPDDTLLTSSQSADWLGLSRQSMAPLRCRDIPHPPYVKIGGIMVRYRLGDLRQWVRSRTFTNTTAATVALGSGQ